jgi:hypothetical protein
LAQSTDGMIATWATSQNWTKKQKPTALLFKLFIFKGKMYMSMCVDLFFWMLLISNIKGKCICLCVWICSFECFWFLCSRLWVYNSGDNQGV